MKHIAVLLTVHNRKDKTFNCLSNLFAQEMPVGYDMAVFLTDDGSTDGTSQMIRSSFPEVNIIPGDGNLYWNRGMIEAWNAAAKHKDYDFFLWLNDDSFLLTKAIEKLLIAAEKYQDEAIVVGALRDPKTGQMSYGGRSRTGLIEPAEVEERECETMNGNIVLVPRKVFKEVGNLDWAYRHAIGDIDYGFRAIKAGFKIIQPAEYLGECEDHGALPAWARPEVPFLKRCRNLYSPLGYAEPIPYFHFDKKHFGIVTAIKHFITIHIRLCFPALWKK